MDSLENFVEKCDLLQYGGEMEDDHYTVEVTSSDEFSKLFNTVSTNKDLSPDEDSVATVNKSHFIFTDGYYEIELKADFDKDLYSAVVRER